MESVLISIIIPAFNEEQRIGRTLSSVRSTFVSMGIKYELIVVDDGSTDKTAQVASTAGKTLDRFLLLRHERNMGKGAAVRSGVKAASGRWILLTDADSAVPLTEFSKLWNRAQAGYTVVIATRRGEGANVVRGQGRVRGAFGRMFRILTKLFVIADVSDTQCGFKLMSAGIGKKAFSKTAADGPLFDIEFLLNAHRMGAVIAEVPVVWSHDPRTTMPYSFRSALAVFRDLILLKLRFRIILPLSIT
jgi:dolichyl-phosphate beta-glucosyltransferase